MFLITNTDFGGEALIDSNFCLLCQILTGLVSFSPKLSTVVFISLVFISSVTSLSLFSILPIFSSNPAII